MTGTNHDPSTHLCRRGSGQAPPAEQDILAGILLEEIASEAQWSKSFAKSEPALESLAAEALAEFRAGRTKPLDELL